MGRKKQSNLALEAFQRGYESVAVMLLDLMHRHRSVTQVSIELGCAIQTVSQTLYDLEWKREGSTSDTVWISPAGDRIHTWVKDPDPKTKPKPDARALQKLIAEPIAPRMPDGLKAALQAAPEPCIQTQGDRVLIVDLLDQKLKVGYLVVTEERALPDNRPQLLALAKREGFDEQYTRGRVQWLKVLLGSGV